MYSFEKPTPVSIAISIAIPIAIWTAGTISPGTIFFFTGFFAEGRRARMYGKKFEEVAFALKKGEMSDVFETEFGCFIVRLDDRQPRTEQSLAEAKSKIARKLQQTKQKEAYDSYVESLKAKYPVKYNQK